MRLSLFHVCLLACLVANGSAGETPGILSGGQYTLTAECSGKLLTVAGGGTADGTNVYQWTEKGTSDQQWAVTYLGNDVYKVVCVGTTKALTVAAGGLTDGANIEQSTFVATNTSQQWKIIAVGGGWFKLICKASGKAMDVNGRGTGDGVNVQQWGDNNSSAQHWMISAVSLNGATSSPLTPSVYKLAAKHSGKVLSVAGSSTANGANVMQDSDHGLTSQRWNLSYSASGAAIWTAQHSGKVLEVAGSSLANGGNVQQGDNLNATNQQWIPEYYGNDYFRFKAVHSSKYVDVSGVSTADGANVHQWSLAGDNQLWKATPCYSLTTSQLPLNTTIATGDELTLTSQVAGTISGYEACGTSALQNVPVTVGGKVTIPSSAPGFYTYVITKSDGQVLPDLKVTVVRTNLSVNTLADEIGYARTVSLTVEPAGAPVSFVTSNASLITLGIPTATGTTTGIVAKSKSATAGSIVAVIQGPSGHVAIARQMLQPFTIKTNATQTIGIIEVFPDGSKIGLGTLTQNPLIRNLDINMRTFVSGITFEDSTTSKVYSTNAFTSQSNGSGTFPYRLLKAPVSHANMCHEFYVTERGITVSQIR